jgi:AcrR family transcriptional regulator
VVRSRAAVVDAARTLFLRNGYAGTTMEEIAALAGLTKRTVYNNYGDKDALFREVVADVLAYAESFARGLHEEFTVGVTAANLRATLDDLGRRLALGIVRLEVVALRRLLIGEARAFPALGAEYFSRRDSSTWGGAGCCGSQMHAEPRRSSRTWWPVSHSTGRCSSGRFRRRSRSSSAREKESRRS